MNLTPSIIAAATEALGGEPVRPPAMPTQPVKAAGAAAVPDARPDAGVVTAGAEARAAFQPQAIGTPAAAVPAFGNTTFDGPPPELAERRSKTEVTRRRLANLAALITAEQSALGSLLDDLADDAAELKSAEHFDVGTARKFLTDLAAVVAALSAPAATAAKEKPTKKTK